MLAKNVFCKQYIDETVSHWVIYVQAVGLEFLTGGVELLWGKCTVFPVPVQGILTGGT